jgi:hypothetical protein
MAHGDYHCCAMCDCKMDYSGWDSTTKERFCETCVGHLSDLNLPVTRDRFLLWAEAHTAELPVALGAAGYNVCFYSNEFDKQIAKLLAPADATKEAPHAE